MQPQGYALITGASSGIGEEFARQLAARGWSLILVARSQDRLEKVRSELMSAHMGIDVVAIPLDLTISGAPADLFQRTQAAHLDVDLLINNAGFGAFAEFASLDLGRVRQMLDLNIVALVELTHLYLQPMMQRRRGGIINVASVAGFAPLPYSTVYAATKAFVKSFSDALYQEARQRGVHIMAVNPGSTETNFFRVAGVKPIQPSGPHADLRGSGARIIARLRAQKVVGRHRGVESPADCDSDVAASAMDHVGSGKGDAACQHRGLAKPNKGVIAL